MKRLQFWITSIAALTIVLAAWLGAIPARAIDATAIFERARTAVNALPQPRYIAFTLAEDAYLPTPDRPWLRVLVRLSDGAAVIATLKDQFGDDARDRNVHVETGNDWRPATISRLGDFPLANFGLRSASANRPDFFEAGSGNAAGQPPVIAQVYSTRTPAYAIVDLGDTQIDGRAVFHLGLTPIYEPARHPLREMWIDKTSCLPVRYVAEKIMDGGAAYYTYLLTVDAKLIGPYLVNIKASGLDRYGKAGWSVEQISFPESEPDWVFDPAQWTAHHGEQIPALAPPSR